MNGPQCIYDAHVHYWDPHTTPRLASPFARLLGKRPRLMRHVARAVTPSAKLAFVGDPRFVLAPYLPAEHARGFGGSHRFEGVTHVEAGWVARHRLALADESRWLDQLDPAPRALVGAAYLDAPDIDGQLRAHLAAGATFVGVRDKLAHSPSRGVVDWSLPGRMRTARFGHGMDALAGLGLTFDAFVYSEQLWELYELARAHPDVRIALCHMGTPVALAGPYGSEGLTHQARLAIERRWRASLVRLAECDNVHVKLSGMLMPVVGWGFERRSPHALVGVSELHERIGPHYDFVLDTFGPRRCMFGSNFPMDAVSTDLPTLVAVMARTLASRTAEERDGVFCHNAVEFYRAAPGAKEASVSGGLQNAS